MVIAVIIALFQPWPLVIWVTLYFIVIQQVHSNVLEPRIGGRILGLHAVVVITAVIAGAAVAGILGAFLALPVVSAFTTLGLALYLDIRCRTNLLLPRRGPAVPETEVFAQKRNVEVDASLTSELAPEPEPVAVAESDPDIADGARDAALMFKDRLDFVLEEQDRLRASYEQIAAQQSAKERKAHGLA